MRSRKSPEKLASLLKLCDEETVALMQMRVQSLAITQTAHPWQPDSGLGLREREIGVALQKPFNQKLILFNRDAARGVNQAAVLLHMGCTAFQHLPLQLRHNSD